MSTNVKPVPDCYHTVTPYLLVKDGARALDFYAQALGAVERFRMPAPDGSIMHAELQIGDSIVMLASDNPQATAKPPETLGGTSVNVFLYVEDVDAAYKRAIESGATELFPPTDMFWGDRYSKLQDPFGHEWSIATHIEDVPPEQMDERARAMFAQQAGS